MEISPATVSIGKGVCPGRGVVSKFQKLNASQGPPFPESVVLARDANLPVLVVSRKSFPRVAGPV
jgi:hypothetical protein